MTAVYDRKSLCAAVYDRIRQLNRAIVNIFIYFSIFYFILCILD
jgi:hypothetical protein